MVHPWETPSALGQTLSPWNVKEYSLPDTSDKVTWPLQSSKLRKNNCGTVEIQWAAHLGQQENRAQDAQKGQTSHPPNPGGYFTLPP